MRCLLCGGSLADTHGCARHNRWRMGFVYLHVAVGRIRHPLTHGHETSTALARQLVSVCLVLKVRIVSCCLASRCQGVCLPELDVWPHPSIACATMTSTKASCLIAWNATGVSGERVALSTNGSGIYTSCGKQWKAPHRRRDLARHARASTGCPAIA